jgi:uncharacterized membrane protein
MDEPFTLYYAQQGVSAIFQMLFNENNPPFHFLLMHYWIKLFGLSAFAVRLPSLLFSAFTAVYIFKIGKEFFSKQIGVIAALIFSFSSMQLYFAHEARVYTLFVLLTSICLYYFLKIKNETFQLSALIALFAANFLLIYSHYFGFFVVLMEAVCMFFLESKKIYALMVMFTLLVLSYLPMLFIFFHRYEIATKLGTWVAPPSITELYGNLNRFVNDRAIMLVLILLFLFYFLLLLRLKRLKEYFNSIFKNRNVLILIIWFVLPYLLMFALSYKAPMFIDRYILYTSIPFYCIIAVSIYYLPLKSIFKTAGLFLFLCIMLFTLQLNPDNKRRLKELSETIKSLKKENTFVLIAPDYAFMGFAYHYNISYFKAAPNTLNELAKENIYTLNSLQATKNQLLANKNKNCIYLQADTQYMDAENEILNTIARNYRKHSIKSVYEIYQVHYFSNP